MNKCEISENISNIISELKKINNKCEEKENQQTKQQQPKENIEAISSISFSNRIS